MAARKIWKETVMTATAAPAGAKAVPVTAECFPEATPAE